MLLNEVLHEIYEFWNGPRFDNCVSGNSISFNGMIFMAVQLSYQQRCISSAVDSHAVCRQAKTIPSTETYRGLI